MAAMEGDSQRIRDYPRSKGVRANIVMDLPTTVNEHCRSGHKTTKKGPVAADWFTGELWEFFGEIEYYSDFRSDMRIYVFKNGRLTGTKEQKSSELK